MQSTIARDVSFSGVGVHSGEPAVITVRPAAPSTGFAFRRIDVTDRNNVIPAQYDLVVDTKLCTVLSNAAGTTISTVEHLLAALAGLGIDNVTIDVDGPEVPIMDGSAAPFVEGLSAAGVVVQHAPRPAIEILRRVTVKDGAKAASLKRAPRFEMAFEIDFEDAAIGRQQRSTTLVNGAFVSELANARTFGRLWEVERLRAAGLALGGSLENAIVIDGARVLNEGGLRYEDEFVRHKMLDAIGDLSLAGAPIIGAYDGVRAGHEMNNRLLRALFADPTAWRWVEDDLSVLANPNLRMGSGLFAAA